MLNLYKHGNIVVRLKTKQAVKQFLAAQPYKHVFVVADNGEQANVILQPSGVMKWCKV